MIVERDSQLDALNLLLAECKLGTSSVAVITGPVSAGKTELLRMLSERASDEGFLVLHATAFADVGDGLPSLLEQLGASVGLEDQPVTAQSSAHATNSDEAADLAPPGAAPSDDSQPRQAANSEGKSAGYQTYQTLTRISQRQPLLISVDDAQYADSASVECLLYLARRCRNVPIMVAVACGPQRCDAYPPLIGELLYQNTAHHFPLGMLGREGVLRLLSQQLNEGEALRQVDTFMAMSGGNPALVKALIADELRKDKRVEGQQPLVAVSAFQQIALACIHRSGRDELKVARGIAAFGKLPVISILSQMTGLEDRATVRAVQSLTMAGVLFGGRFRARVIRVALLDEMTAEDTAHLRYRAAVTLRNTGANPVEIARQLLTIGPVREFWAVTALCQAAETSAGEDRVAIAIKCLQLALRSCADEGQRLKIRARLAAVESRLRPMSGMQHYLSLVSPSDASNPTGSTALRAIRPLLIHGHVDDAVSLARSAAGSWDAGDDQTSARTKHLRLWLAVNFPGIEHHIVNFLPAIPDGLPSGDAQWPKKTRALGTLLKVISTADANLDPQVDHVLDNLRTVTEHDIEAAVFALAALVYADRLRSAEASCTTLLGGIESRNASTWAGMLWATHALISLRRGMMQRAVSAIERALELMPSHEWGVTVVMPLAILVEAHVALGNIDAAAEVLARPVRELSFQTRFGLHYLYARGIYGLATEGNRAALSDFLLCGNRMRAWNLDSPALVPWRSAAAVAYLKVGERETAARLIGDELAMTSDRRPRSRGIALHAASTIAAAEQRIDVLNQAAILFHQAGDPYWLSRVHVDLAEACERSGDVAGARSHLERAAMTWNRHGGDGLYSITGERSDDDASEGMNSHRKGVNAGRPQPAVLEILSDAEFRVAVLAAKGCTNKEISAKLFITVSTVEQHMTRIYRKTGIRQRNDLGRFIEGNLEIF